MRWIVSTTVLLIFGTLTAGRLPADEPPPAFSEAQLNWFESEVRPLLSQRCGSCHGGEKQESDLRLDSRVFVLAGGASGEPAAVPGEPDASVLIQAVRGTGDYAMPPDEPLADEEIAVLERWVAEGLPWPASEAAPTVLTMEQRLEESRQQHWSLQPLQSGPLPDVADTAWPQRGVDRFVLAELEARQLTPSPEADRRTLLRRLKFDLLGLPPTAAEIEAFVADRRPDAYLRWVERYLASPRYGERWGRHWLDVARYADTSGYAFARDRNYPYAYTYRDYVIAALNEDRSYDRFVLEQLAADQLDLGEQRDRLAALGFLTVGRRFNNIHDDIDDRIDVVTRGLMGLTVACARCHDHKYDAIPTEDYYSLYGVFISSDEPGELPLIGTPEEIARNQAYASGLAEREQALNAFQDQRHGELLEHARSHVTEYLVRCISQQPEPQLQQLSFVSLRRNQLIRQLLGRWRGHLQRNASSNDPVLRPWAELAEHQGEAFATRVTALQEALQAGTGPTVNPLVREAFLENPPATPEELAAMYGRLFESIYAAWKEAGGGDRGLNGLSVDQQQLALVLVNDQSPTNLPRDQLAEFLDDEGRQQLDQLRQQRDAHLATSPGPIPRAMVLRDREQPVTPVVFVRGSPERRGDSVPRQFLALLEDEARTPFQQGSGRLELAQRIVADENPLTPRVLANRVWMHHFGEPLADSPSDFGIRSEPPQHLPLLDYLAGRLQRGGWSLKDLHREIVLSATYRQQSIDRPAARAIDPENRLWWRMNRQRLELEPLRDALLAVADRLDTRMGGPSSPLTSEPFSRRRAVYGYIDRQDLPNVFRAFDFASPDQSAARRPQTSVPQRALYLMNSPFVIEQARAVAAAVDWDAADPPGSVTRLYRRVLARAPDAAERDVAVGFLTTPVQDEATALSRWEQLAQLLLLTNEFAYVD